MPQSPGATIDDEAVMRLRDAIMLTARRLRATAAEENLTATQSGVLATLVRQGALRPGDLAAAEAVNPTMLSRVLAHLEGAGVVERVADPEDGRCAIVRPTAAGRRLVGRMRARRAQVLHDRVRELPPDQVALLVAALPALEALAQAGGVRP